MEEKLLGRYSERDIKLAIEVINEMYPKYLQLKLSGQSFSHDGKGNYTIEDISGTMNDDFFKQAAFGRKEVAEFGQFLKDSIHLDKTK